MKAVIDSDVLIDYLQGHEEARREIDRYNKPLYSVVSWMEVMCGADDEEEKMAAAKMLSSLRRIDLSMEIAAVAVRERKNTKLKFRTLSFLRQLIVKAVFW